MKLINLEHAINPQNKLTVNILGFDFLVNIGEVESIGDNDEETQTVGRIDPINQEIHVYSEQHIDRINTTFIHEVLHAILQITANMNQYHNEELIDALAFGLASLELKYTHK